MLTSKIRKMFSLEANLKWESYGQFLEVNTLNLLYNNYHNTYKHCSKSEKV